MDLIKHSQLLPEKPTAADTADWYRLGDAVEKHGRHMKRQAVAAEYNSGRDNMAAWYHARFCAPVGLPHEHLEDVKKNIGVFGHFFLDISEQ